MGVLIYLLNWWGTTGSPDRRALEFEIKPLPQRVNQPEPEYATFGVLVRNLGAKSVAITHAELSPITVDFEQREKEFKMLLKRIRHDGHHTVFLQNPQAGKPVRFTVPILIPARSSQEFFIWLRLADWEERPTGFLRMEARLTLYSEGSEMFTSQPFTVSIYSTRDPAWLKEDDP